MGVAASRGWAGVGITVGFTVGIIEGMGVASTKTAIVGVGVAGRVTGGVLGVGCPVSILAGVAPSPPHAVNMRIINAAADSNLTGKVRTRIPTLPLPPVPTEPVSFPPSISDWSILQ